MGMLRQPNKSWLGIIALAFFMCACSGAMADEAPPWQVVQSTGMQHGAGGVMWQARFLDENLPEKHRDEAADRDRPNFQVNFNRRKLVIEVFDAASQSLLRREELPALTETVQGEICSTIGLSQLSAEQDRLVLEFNHEVNCGAGSGGAFSYRINVGKSGSQIIAFHLDDASREVLLNIDIDYAKGRLTRSVADPAEEDSSPAPESRRIPKGGRPLDSNALLHCPFPLSGEMPSDCDVWAKPPP